MPNNKSGKNVTTAGVVFSQFGETPVNPLAGQKITVVKDASGKIVSTAGQVPGTDIVHVNPA